MLSAQVLIRPAVLLLAQLLHSTISKSPSNGKGLSNGGGGALGV